MRQVDMADQSGTGQRENSDQIPDVSVTQKNLCHQATQPRSQGPLSTSRKYPGYGWSRVC